MGQLITYLKFNGNCREAMEFYQQCLGGELLFQTVDESHRTKGLPEPMKAYIVQAFLKKDNLVLMGTDMADEEVSRGNAISILLDCNDEDRIKTYYQKLETEGKGSVQFPHDTPLPSVIIKRMTKYRYEEKLKEK